MAQQPRFVIERSGGLLSFRRTLTAVPQGDYAGAKPLYERAIEIGEKTLRPNHPDLATRLNNLAELLESQVSF